MPGIFVPSELLLLSIFLQCILQSVGNSCDIFHVYLQVCCSFQSYGGGFGMIPGSESHGELQNILYIVGRFPQKF